MLVELYGVSAIYAGQVLAIIAYANRTQELGRLSCAGSHHIVSANSQQLTQLVLPPPYQCHPRQQVNVLISRVRLLWRYQVRAAQMSVGVSRLPQCYTRTTWPLGKSSKPDARQ